MPCWEHLGWLLLMHSAFVAVILTIEWNRKPETIPHLITGMFDWLAGGWRDRG